MTTVIGGSAPSITFSDSTTQSTAALPLTGGTLTGGLTLATWTTSGRPSAPATGTTGYNTTYGGVEVYNGSAWDTITGGPAFSATNSTTQSVGGTSYTKVVLNTKNFDTNSNFDATTNYRFTPTIAGYYQINAQATLNTNANNVGIALIIYKNGSAYSQGVSQGDSQIYPVATVSSVIYLNGSTDYVEMYVYLSTAGNIGSTNSSTQFSGAMIRSA